MTRSILLLLLGASLAGATTPDVLISDLSSEMIHGSPAFEQKASSFALDGDYLASAAAPGGPPAGIRLPAPAGEYYVYLAWVRHPKSARDVLVRLAGKEYRVNQRRLACGLDPAQVTQNDMAENGGVVGSGLYRLTDGPVRLAEGDALEIVRSDNEPETITSLDYVLFSPSLYLDDLGNDAVVERPTVNLRDYGRDQSGEIGLGVALLSREDDAPGSRIEWKVPVAGRFLLACKPFCGPNRAAEAAVMIHRPDGESAEARLPMKAAGFGRSDWRTLAVLDAERGMTITMTADPDGLVVPDLLRLTPVSRETVAHGDAREVILQWAAPSAERPWLRRVRVVPTGNTSIQVDEMREAGPLPNGVRVRFAQRVPVVGSQNEEIVIPGDGAFRVELAEGYGFSLSTDLLEREPFVWLRELGMFASAEGSYDTMQEKIASLEATVEKARRQPFRSPSEQYWDWLGAPTWQQGTDGKAFQFAYNVPRPRSPRVAERVRTMPEVDYSYFCKRVPDVRFHRMFLGWPNVAQEFTVFSNGMLTVNPSSSKGTGHPVAAGLQVSFGTGQRPQFPVHGDPGVRQSIENGYHLAVRTGWQQAETLAVAYPLAGEEVRTGWESLAAFVRFRRTEGNQPLWLKLSELSGLDKLTVEDGYVLAGDRLVLSVDGADVSLASSDKATALLKVLPHNGHADVVIPYVEVKRELFARARELGFDSALAAAKRYWDERLARGAVVDVPDEEVALQYKTFYPRIVITGDLDTRGDYALKTSPTHYEAVWLHVTSHGIEALCRRGYFEEARQYLEACFHWQGAQPVQEAPQYTSWEGFFNAPPHYTELLWVNFHGWVQWASARYYLYSDDRPWLDEKLPALIKSLEWTASQRRLTMRENPEGVRPPNYGWLPPGRVTDGSVGTSTFSDCVNWMGFKELVTVLERIGHPRAAEFRQVADDYRACILRGLKMATADREPVRLADGTYLPYVPGYLESMGHETNMWYAAVVDAALVGILDTGILEQAEREPLEDWVCHNLQDNLFVMAPNLADEGHFLGHGCAYVRRDEPELAVYTLYSCLATQMARETRTTYEHRSWGARRVYELTPWSMGYFNRMLCGMLCYDGGDRLVIGRAIPRAWLEPGKRVHVERLQTRFGPVGFALSAEENSIHGVLDLPSRYNPTVSALRLRVRGRVESVKLNGKRVAFDPTTETVALPVEGGRVEVEAAVVRKEASGP